MAGEEARRYGHPPESGAASCSTVAVAPPPRLHISQSMPQLDPLAGAPLGGLCGLRNLGNTCYFNSIVQALSHLPQLVAYYQSQYTAPPSPASRDRMPASVSGALGAHLQRYWLLGSGLGGERGSGLGGGGEMQIRVLDPRALLSHVCAVNPMFRGYAQHDAQELLRTVVDRMHDELKGPAVAGAGGESIISGLFGGALRSTVTCSVCRHSSHKEEPFYDLSLGLPDAQVLAVLKARGMAVKRELMELQVGGGGGGFFSRLASWAGFSDDAIFLEECLHAFCLPEALSGPNRLYCEHCRCPTDGVKTLRITRLPEVLVLHLKRFRYDSIWASKLSTEVKAPAHQLSMREMLVCSDGDQATDCCYDLVATVSHSGSISGGHYVAYCYHQHLKTWLLFDDARISRVSLSMVLASEAYLLFYQKCDPSRSEEREKVLRIISEATVSGGAEARYICAKWYFRWRHVGRAGPIDNSSWMCPHGCILAGHLADPQAVVLAIPEQAWRLLHATYGGGPEVAELVGCEACEAQKVEERNNIRSLEADNLIYKGLWYLVSAQWLEQWRNWSRRNSLNTRPGPINNELFFTSTGKLKQHLQITADYRGVSSHTWDYLHGLYGGGPVVCRRVVDIFAPPVDPRPPPLTDDNLSSL